MNNHDGVEIAAAPPRDSGLSVRGLWQVFASPTQFFAKLKDEPKILVPYIVLGILLLGFMLITADLIQKLQVEAMADRLQGQQLPPSAQGVMKISTIVFGTLGFLLEPLIVAGLALFWGNFVFAGKARYRQVLSVTLYCCVLYAVGMWLTLPMILAKGSMIASYSLGILAAGSGPTSFLYQLLSRIGLFYIWEWVVLGIGLSVLFNTKFGKGMTISLLSSGLISAIAILLSIMGSLVS
ncbi:hypothetical protein C3F09_07245 [candidate division GN15 bacterium]|uniref:Yip1 domain-containing protein n=1 Tax=candidate division GN15 bacterium TaxID=2072418 RepID=A0A855X176_9BACT|nr:MAG: hypothetical protein C3F09_07245 [candidate division GN15 bacterium]